MGTHLYSLKSNLQTDFIMAKKSTRKRNFGTKNRKKVNVHPNSRTALKMNKTKELRKRRDQRMDTRDKKYNATREKFIWFFSRAPETPISHAELAELVQEYVSRFEQVKEALDEERAQAE